MSPRRSVTSSRPSAAPSSEHRISLADDSFGLHSFSNFMLIGGDYDAVRELDRSLRQAPRLAWRPAEDVEREVVYVAMKQSKKRIETLDLEDVLQACETVEARHLIDNGGIERHFRNMWHASAAYCRAFMRGLLALKPGEGTTVSTASAPERESFSLARMVLPPYRVLQGSYRYAGRSWCSRTWGTPEDARLVSVRRLPATTAGMAEFLYEFETVDGAPIGALRRLIERQPQLAVSCVSVDRDVGLRMLISGGAGRGVKVRELAPIDLSTGTAAFDGLRRQSIPIAREAVQAVLEGRRHGRRKPAG